MDGFLNLLKPPGLSSAAAVACVKRLTGEKVGHLGTLDPEAAGVLPLMIGRATRLFDDLVDKRKAYVAEIAFGSATDTQDAQGTVTETGDRYPDLAALTSVLPAFTGVLMQTPPSYSALKVDGEPLYKRARRGETVQAAPREALVHSIVATRETEKHGFLLTVECGRGVYIRTLCHDIGQALSCPAHMRFLLRKASGPFEIADAHTLEEMQAGDPANMLLPLDWPLSHLPRLDVNPTFRKPFVNGVRLDEKAYRGALPMQGGRARAYIDGRFTGIVERREDGSFSMSAMLIDRGEVE